MSCPSFIRRHLHIAVTIYPNRDIKSRLCYNSKIEGSSMTNKFSRYLRSKKKLIRALIDQLGTRYPYVSVLGTDVSGTTIVVDKSTANVVPSGLSEAGFVIKVFNGQIYSELSTNEITKKNIPILISEINRLAAHKSTIAPVKVKGLNEEPLTKRFVRKNKGQSYTVEEIISILKG